MNETLTLHFDGGSRGNPGPAGCGSVVAAEDGTPLAAVGKFLGTMTNNQAEYHGLINALEKAAELGGKQVLVIGDSELVIKQMKGQYRVKNEKLKPLYQRALDAAAKFEKVQYDHARRDKNQMADGLANKAMDAKRDVEE
jgi:probable phosphoglycerate mutase